MLAAGLAALVGISWLSASKSTARAKDVDDTTKRLNAAADVLGEIMSAPDKGIPVDLLGRANCVVIVPGMIARSNTVAEDGNLMPETGSQNVSHRTPHPDRWGGWFVTSEDAAPPYAQMAHRGNITFSGHGNTSNQVFVDWLNASPTSHGYLSSSSDIVALLVFDHQMHAINLLTRLNWESRVAASAGEAGATSGALPALVNELADYLLFADEAPPLAPLTPPAAFAASLEARTPRDRRGRSFGQLDAVNRLLRYPCSYMVYSDAFNGLPKQVRAAVYSRMLAVLSGREARAARVHLTPAESRAILEILRDTKPDFPAE
jgi:hypothetical protein